MNELSNENFTLYIRDVYLSPLVSEDSGKQKVFF